MPEKAGDCFECAGHGMASPIMLRRSTSTMYSAPQISQLIEDRLSEISSAPRCFNPSFAYFFSVTTTRSLTLRWPINALGISAPHCTFENSSARAVDPGARQIRASSDPSFFTFVLVRFTTWASTDR